MTNLSDKVNLQGNLKSAKSHSSLSHSPLFDEVMIALSSGIDVPVLKTVAHNIHTHMFSDEQGVLEGHDEINCDVGSELKGDIRDANHILQHLLDTPNADAAVLVVMTLEPNPKLLLTRRAGHLNAHAGEVSFVGGKHDLCDGNNIVTALREASEEVGLPVSKVQIVGQLPTQTSKSGMSVRPIVALVEPNIVYVPELGEIDKIFWADFHTLIKQPTEDYEIPYRMDGNMIEIVTPSWTVDGEVVWGLTARIIASLLEICFGREIIWYYRAKED